MQESFFPESAFRKFFTFQRESGVHPLVCTPLDWLFCLFCTCNRKSAHIFIKRVSIAPNTTERYLKPSLFSFYKVLFSFFVRWNSCPIAHAPVRLFLKENMRKSYGNTCGNLFGNAREFCISPYIRALFRGDSVYLRIFALHSMGIPYILSPIARKYANLCGQNREKR